MTIKPSVKVLMRKAATAVVLVGLTALAGKHTIAAIVEPFARAAALETACRATWRGVPAEELVDIDPECARALTTQ